MFYREIFHVTKNLIRGPSISRYAVRAIIRDGNKLLMVYAQKNNEYKFPGGGVQIDETGEEALVREIREEVGGRVIRVNGRLGRVTEFNKLESDTDHYFKMISDYYEVIIEKTLSQQKLDRYEQELGFEPKWVDIQEAIWTNEDTMNREGTKISRWITRETGVLRDLLELVKAD